MIFREYIDILKSTGLFTMSIKKLGHELFLSADPQEDVTDDTINSWIYRSIPRSMTTYFPERKINNTEKFIKYFTDIATDSNSWKTIQKAFSSQKLDGSLPEDFRVDLETNNSDKFFWSLMNQFERIFRLLESEWVEKNSATPATPKKELTPSVLRDIFLRLAEDYEIMDRINREPPILNRDDGAYFDIFTDDMRLIVTSNYDCTNILHLNIFAFHQKLQHFALALDRWLNERFGWDNMDAALNMYEMDETDDEDIKNGEIADNINDDYIGDEGYDDDYDNDDNDDDGDDDDGDDDDDDDDDDDEIDIEKYITMTPSGIPVLDEKLLKRVDDPIAVLKILYNSWSTFHKQMNILYGAIFSWQDGA